jgi:hypothetical protein
MMIVSALLVLCALGAHAAVVSNDCDKFPVRDVCLVVRAADQGGE